MSDALSALRAGTRALHEAVESCALPRRVMSGQVTLGDYRDFLQAHRAIVQAWARGCPPAIRRASGCDPQARWLALQADLSALAVPDVPAHGTPGFAWPEDAPQWWGALYVLEGSRLGGRVVARHLRARLGAAARDAFAYLDARGGDAPGTGPATLRRLQEALPPARQDAAVQGAVATFRRFEAAFA